MKVWPKIHLICYPFLGNSTTHTTIVPLTKLDAVYRALISPDNLNPKLIPLARYYTVSEMIFFCFFLWVSRSQLLFQILIVLMYFSHSRVRPIFETKYHCLKNYCGKYYFSLTRIFLFLTIFKITRTILQKCF